MRELVLVFCCFILAFAGCRFAGGKRVNGNNRVSTEQRNLRDFESIEVSGPMNVYLTQGETYSIKIEAEENLLPYIETEQDGSTLEIRTRRNTSIRSHRDMNVYITAPHYAELQVAGSGTIRTQSRISNPSRLAIEIAGSGDVYADVDAPEVKTQIGGSGSASLRGTTRVFSADIGGSGDIKAFDLMAETVDADIAGSGNMQVYASKQLDVSIAGAGDVRYKGSPAVKQSKLGSGSVTKVN